MWAFVIVYSLLLAVSRLCLCVADVPCEWRSFAGGHFDLRPLTVLDSSAKSYYILDGDIPCTPEKEPAFSYVWNFCAPVTAASLPGACSKVGKSGVALQYLQLQDASDCYIIGRYDATRDDLSFSLLNPNDPSKGVTLSYPTGEKCDVTGIMRSVTLDLQCANTKTTILSAQSPQPCQYRMQMKSWYGCPTECPITSNGLCNSHGHCSYDVNLKQPYCFCNAGWYGNDCSSTQAPTVPASYDGHAVQVGLLIALLVIVLVLIAVVGGIAYKIIEFRKAQAASEYASLPGRSGHEGTGGIETVTF